ncbi:ABC transporter substrate-binding protein [Bacteroidota bacterium]|nr:ABC transporter substrate-binding protein [Bacteroidota bacterium]
MKKIIFTFLSISLILSSCVNKRDLSTNTVVAHILSQPDGLHPYNNNSVMRSYIFSYTQKTLLGLNLESLDYEADLIKELPTSSEDNKTFYFELKDKVTWDNGEQLTAEDIVFSSKIMLCHLTNNSQIRPIYNSVIKSVKADPNDPLKFSMTAQDINWTAKTIMGGIYVQQKSYWDPNGLLDNITFDQILNRSFKETDEISNWFNDFNHADNGYKPKNLKGLGPYYVSEWEASQYVTLLKKKNWWGAGDSSLDNKAFPEKIIFKIIKEDASSYLALKNQEIDVTTNIGTVKLMKLREREYFNNNYDSDFLDRYGISYIGLNMKPDGIKHKPFFVDKNVRRAVAYMIPIDEIIEVMMHGKASRQASNISPLKKTYNDTLKLIPLDIEKAKELLDEAGWVDTDGDNIRDKVINGVKTPFTFKFSYMSSPTSKEIVLMIKESMYKAGIVAEPTPMDFSLFYKNAADHKFDAMLAGWGSSAAYSNPMQLWHTSSWVNKGSNFCGFGDAYSDALIDEANKTLDYETHRNALLKLQAKIYEDQPYVFLWITKRKFAVHKRFDNRDMFFEFPGLRLNNLKLNNNYAASGTIEDI